MERLSVKAVQSGDLKFAHHFGRNCGFTFCEQLILHDWLTHSSNSPGAAPAVCEAAALAAGVIGPRGPAAAGAPDDGGGAASSAGVGGGGGGSFDEKRLLVDVQPARLTINIAMNNRVTSVSPLLVPLDACAMPRQPRNAAR
jgi:hypothetical protein